MNDKRGRRDDAANELREAEQVASQFAVASPVTVRPFAIKGNINQRTYLVEAGLPPERSRRLLQLLNPAVFKEPRVVMQNMIACINAQNETLSKGALPAGREWETLKLVPTKGGEPFLEAPPHDAPRCWRMMHYIGDARSFKNLAGTEDHSARIHLAEEAGRGLALFGRLTAGLDPSKVRGSLAGYRDTALYYGQLHSILEENRSLREAAEYLPADAELRQAAGDFFLVRLKHDEYLRRRRERQATRCITRALEEKTFALKLADGLESGSLAKTVIHGDAKLENFLFSALTENVKALIDLDTIMPHSRLSDWGDLARSLANIAGERERTPEKILVDADIFEAAARGFSEYAVSLSPAERALMVDAPRIMALELGVRFLADYLRGDTYFSLKPEDPPDLNRTRAAVQFRFAEEIARNSAALQRAIERCFPAAKETLVRP